MDQNALFQMTSTATKYFPWINIQDCFKDDFGEKNFDHFLMRAVTIQNARSTVYNIWDAFSGYTTRRAFRHPILSDTDTDSDTLIEISINWCMESGHMNVHKHHCCLT